jgi:hypothetical protein
MSVLRALSNPRRRGYRSNPMSRKHYKQVAEAIRIAYTNDPQCGPVLNELAKDFASMFKRDNSRFDYDRFFTACGFSRY